MIPFASQRGLGQDLATHLLNAQDNERVELAGLRGAVARDLHGAMAEWEAQAHALTRCRNYLYSLSINPDPAQGGLSREQYEDYIARVESKLGLTGQPRAMIFHEKYGREHCHVVWSRIDAEKGKAVPLAFDHDKLMMVTREFARDHGLDLPDGYARDRENRARKGQLSLYEMHQQRATGLTKEERIKQVTEAWRRSDSPRAFVQALAERGYILATGKRPYVLVDLYGEMNALPRLIADKSVRTKDIRAFLEKEYPPQDLPSVEEARKLAARHRKQIEAHLRNERKAAAFKDLDLRQAQRRQELEAQQDALRQRQHEARQALAAEHKLARREVRQRQVAAGRQVKLERHRKRPQGLADFLGRVTGVNALRRQIHRWQDRQRVKAFLAQRQALGEEQKADRLALARRQEMQSLEMERKARALAAVDKRERAALEQTLKAEARIAGRGGGTRIPAVPLAAGKEVAATFARDTDRRQKEALAERLEEEFARDAAGTREETEIDLGDAFARAGKNGEKEEGRGSSGGPKPADEPEIRRYGPRRDKENDLDRGR